ncbi:MAG: DUF4178 domain-containing protein [Blastocatellia bacterium]|nr:DUF4178 domain-containing protein [Blastocatellia bacterium]
MINFKIGSSIVVVCEYCNSVVARGDRNLEDLGKVADLMETGSPLDIGLRGIYQGVPFELTGRAQLGHGAGGVWDEWYAAFADGRWGWLAEAQGRFYMTFEATMSEERAFPPFEALELGRAVPAMPGSVPLVVAEKSVGRAIAAKGEIPYRLLPGAEYYFADLSGPRGEFATLDYGEMPPSVFIGREVTLSDLAIPETALSPEREARRVQALQLSCPQCGGPLELRAPDIAERVTCPNCGSLLDVSQGKLKFMQALRPGQVVPIIPIGATGEFEEGRLFSSSGKLTVIGFLQRSVEFSGVRYYWEEYLLYNPRIGFRWLVRSDDNWNFVQSVPPGEVIDSGRTLRFRGKKFKLYQDTTVRVEYVQGEFYWKVMAGELVRAADYIHPPMMLSKEVSALQPSPGPTSKRGRQRQPKTVETGEVNWSLGTYLKHSEVEKTFGIKGLPRTSKVAPNQPFPHKKVYRYWGLMLLAAFILGLVIIATGSYRTVFEQSYTFDKMENAETPRVEFSQPFDLKARENIRFIAKSNVDNSWLFVQGDLIDEATGLVQSFSLPVEYYHGVDGGESWSEGDRDPEVHLSALPAGKYTLRLEVSWEKWQQGASVNVKVDQGVPRLLHLLLTLLFLSIIPVLVLFYHLSFERRRWADSDYSPYNSS